jgi:predicted ATPase
MRIKLLEINDFCGYKDGAVRFGAFTCLIGQNGAGKTTILNAISLLCSSIDFGQSSCQEFVPDNGMAVITANNRVKKFLENNIRHFNEPESAKGFTLRGLFEHGGKDYEVILTESGFQKNEMVKEPWWWHGICYFAKFDSDMVNFQLKKDLWPKFAKAFEGITGFQVEPDIYSETDLARRGMESEIVVGFWIHKPDGRVYSRRASAGEKKIAKSLSQVVNIPEQRQPEIVLVDNAEMHIHYKRHLKMFEEIKSLFSGKQIVSTTHSVVIMDDYEPKEHLVDVDMIKGTINGQKQFKTGF